MDKLVSACIDGASCVIGKNKEFIALLRVHENRLIPSFRCILYQKPFCAHLCGEHFGEVMNVVTSVIKFIVARTLIVRQFKTLIDEIGNNYPGLLLRSNVRWLLLCYNRIFVLSQSQFYFLKLRRLAVSLEQLSLAAT